MLDLSRRSFLGGLITVAAATVIRPPVLFAKPVIWADGIHDDAPGLNALFAGEEVDVRDDLLRIVSGERVEVTGGTFRICAPLQIVRPYTLIRDVRFFGENSSETYINIADGAHHAHFHNIYSSDCGFRLPGGGRIG